ncbi:MAG: hypothetical protein QXE01_07120 [Sulfolobales archaeon]
MIQPRWGKNPRPRGRGAVSIKPAAGATITAYQNLATYSMKMGLSTPEPTELLTRHAGSTAPSTLNTIQTLEEPGERKNPS